MNGESVAAFDLQRTGRRGILVLHKCGQPVGTRNPPPVYLVLSGFPDPSSSFDEFCKPFEEKYHVVKMAFPDMDAPQLVSSFWGHSIEAIQLALVAVLQDYRGTHNCTRIYLHGFDLGALVTFRVARDFPHLVTKIVQQDIGLIHSPFDMGPYSLVVLWCYQVFLACLFLVSRILLMMGLPLFMVHTLLKPIFLVGFPWFLLMPPSADNIRACASQYAPHTTYPYFQCLPQILKGTLLACEFSPTVPQFFGYGSKNFVSFHSKKYLEQLSSRPDCQIKPYEGNHWFHQDKACCGEFRNDVMKFLDDKQS